MFNLNVPIYDQAERTSWLWHSITFEILSQVLDQIDKTATSYSRFYFIHCYSADWKKVFFHVSDVEEQEQINVSMILAAPDTDFNGNWINRVSLPTLKNKLKLVPDKYWNKMYDKNLHRFEYFIGTCSLWYQRYLHPMATKKGKLRKDHRQQRTV